MTNTENAHPFDIATRLRGENGRYQGRTSENYANMVGPFGGIIAATMLKAALDHSERQGEPIAFTVNYAAPIADGDFIITASPSRTNRSTQHWNIGLLRQDQLLATSTAVFAKRRKTWSSTEIRIPIVPDVKNTAAVTGVTYPSWVKSYDIRLIRGGLPPLITIENEEAFSSSLSLQWIRDEPRRPIDFLSLAAICDSFFPRIYIRRNQIVPAGTVSFTVYFHADSDELKAVGDSEVIGEARANRFSDNYFDQTAEIWSAEGRLLATSSQLVYYKE